MRRLDNDFLSSLTQGCLAELTDMVRSDTTLDLELRGDYINVYYRGSNLLKVSKSLGSSGEYSVHFDANYFADGEKFDPPCANVRQREELGHWLAICPKLKQAIDRWLAHVVRKPEREAQQLAVRDNNIGTVAKSTDFYICDIEYQNESERFDMIAVHWPSTPADRKRATGRRLAFVEIKYGDDALGNLHKHVRDVNRFVADARSLSKFKEDMVRVFNQKRGLRLIDCCKNLRNFSDQPPLLILALANHDPQKTALTTLLRTLPSSPNIDVRVATASFLGYGLYDQGMHSVQTALSRFSEHLPDSEPVE